MNRALRPSLDLVLFENLFVQLNSQPRAGGNRYLALMNAELRFDDIFHVIGWSGHVGSIDFEVESFTQARHQHDGSVSDPNLPVPSERGTDSNGPCDFDGIQCRTDATCLSNVEIHRIGCPQARGSRNVVR